MNKKWVHIFSAMAALAFSAGINTARAQDAATSKIIGTENTGQAGNFGAEYQILFGFLTKISESLQGSKDRESTVTNLIAAPKAVEGQVEQIAPSSTLATAQTKSLSRSENLSRIEGGRSNSVLNWFLSKDFNIDDPFDSFLKLREKDREKNSDLEDAIEKAEVPEFAFAVGLTEALNGFGKDKVREISKDNSPKEDAVESDRDFSTFFTNPSTKE